MKLDQLKTILSTHPNIIGFAPTNDPEIYEFDVTPINIKCLLFLNNFEGEVISMQFYTGFSGSSLVKANEWNARSRFVKAYCLNNVEDVSLEMDVILKQVTAKIVVTDAVGIWVSRLANVGNELF